MLDNDQLAYGFRNRAGANPAERSLITPERSQKLDLLIHLLANLRQALIVCGPEGIGKTTLLQSLQAGRSDQWRIYLLNASPSLSFETIVINLGNFLNLGNSSYGFDLSSLRAYCEKQKVVLILDDAGQLVPGLIGELLDFSESLPGLRLVFSMTYDEFHIKGATDRGVEECHLIELPPLNLKQCGEYLQNLSAQPGAVISFNAVTDSLVADLYRDTHGIPGKLLAGLPQFNRKQKRKSSRSGLWLGVAIICLAAGWTVYSLLPSIPGFNKLSKAGPESLTVAHEPAPANTGKVEAVLPEVQTIGPAAVAPQNFGLTANPDETETAVPTMPAVNSLLTETKAVEAVKPASPAPPVAEAGAIQSVAVFPESSKAPDKAELPVVAAAAHSSAAPQAPEQPINKAQSAKPEKPFANGGDQEWIMSQPAGNYTLQIMVLSNKLAVSRFLKKFADYQDSLKYYTINNNDQEKYVLIYGSFPTAAEARQYKTMLPNEFKQALETRFRAVQKESRR